MITKKKFFLDIIDPSLPKIFSQKVLKFNQY